MAAASPEHDPADLSWAKLAITDPLTGLGNRRSYQEAVLKALEADGELSVMMLDLDRFKPVNDTLGHLIGDQLLCRVADQLRAVIPATDLIARIGGDEFAVLCSPARPQQELEALAAQIIDLLERSFLIEGHPINISVSIGITIASASEMTYELLMRHADLALYDAKEAGRGTFRCFHQSLADRAQARRGLDLDLRRALPLRQLEVHYRSRLDVETGELIGLQAFLFWRHPRRGLMDASDFMPLATQIGLVPKLGSWLLEAACLQAATLTQAPGVAVAVPPGQFAASAINEGSIAEIVERALMHSGLPADKLELQVDEGTVVSEDESVLKELHQLRSLGVRIVMTDFGLGYASVSLHTGFALDGLKLASQFTSWSQSPSNRAVFHAVTTLGASLGLTTYIDGIDSTEQMEELRSAGVGTVRGCRLGPLLSSAKLRSFFA